MWSKLGQFFSINVERLIYTGIVILIAFIVFVLVKMSLGRFGKSKFEKKKRAATIAKLLQSIIRYMVFIIGLITILAIWGLNIGPILAGAGIVGLAVAFGAQTLIKDLISGISIVFDNYYDVGDVVEIKGFKGTVQEVGLKSTKIINWKNEVRIFGNGEILDVTNFSKNPSVAVVEFKVSYKQNVEALLTILEERLSAVRDSFHQILEGPNVIGLIQLGESTYTVRVTAKTLSEQHYQVERAILKLVNEIMEEHKMKLPYQTVVIVNDEKSN